MNQDLRIQGIDQKINAIDQKLTAEDLCEGTASVSSRISGYYRQVSNWNRGKQAEFQDRQTYQI